MASGPNGLFLRNGCLCQITWPGIVWPIFFSIRRPAMRIRRQAIRCGRVPVLSQIGETFAGRVAASLLNAIGLRELVVPTAQDYERLAIELASNHPALASIRSKLGDQRC